MKRTLLMLTTLFLILSYSGLFSASKAKTKALTGIGIQAGYGAQTLNAGLSLKFGNFPVLGLAWNFGNNVSAIGLTCDYWALNQSLGAPFWYFLGVGASVGMAFTSFASAIGLGLRIPVGLQFWVLDNLETFLAPVIGINVLPAFGAGLGVELGIRIHF